MQPAHVFPVSVPYAFETINLGVSAAVLAAVEKNPVVPGFEVPWNVHGPEVRHVFLALWSTLEDWASRDISDDFFTLEARACFKPFGRERTFDVVSDRMLRDLISRGSGVLTEHRALHSNKRYYTPAVSKESIRLLRADVWRSYGPVAVHFAEAVRRTERMLTERHETQLLLRWQTVHGLL